MDGMSELHGQVQDVKGTMNENIDKILKRGATLENLQHKTTELNLGVRYLPN